MSDEKTQRLLRAGTELSKYELVNTELPWRKHRTPYRVFLAEMLLVRTRADIVAKHFERIILRYPTIQTLAFADENELKAMLQPLGLRKRVPYLIKAARYIYEYHNGKIPDDMETLLNVPGVGVYTATAILTFAYGKKLVPADVNVLRFVSRLTSLKMTHETKGSQELRDLIPLLSQSNTGLSAESLLDFTRLICKARKPRCKICVLTKYCSYYKDNNPVESS